MVHMLVMSIENHLKKENGQKKIRCFFSLITESLNIIAVLKYFANTGNLFGCKNTPDCITYS